MKHLLIVTPAPRGSRHGNRITAERWANIVRSLGHRVSILEEYTGQAADALIALHACKCAAAIRRFRRCCRDKPLLVALTGTDHYGPKSPNAIALDSLKLADRIIVLQSLSSQQIPQCYHDRVRVIYQSAVPPTRRLRRLPGVFEVCVSGHMRPVKDPLRGALAVRGLPEASTIRITHIGAALTPRVEARARQEMVRNSRYTWLGNVPHSRAKQLLARSRLLLITSKQEGAPAVVSEALAAGVPIISSRIDGVVGLLGKKYPGYFPVGDTRALRDLLERCERDPRFYAALQDACRQQARLIAPQREREAWRELLAEIF